MDKADLCPQLHGLCSLKDEDVGSEVMVCFTCLKQRQVTRAEFQVLEKWMAGPLA